MSIVVGSACSGDMYVGVPTIAPTSLKLRSVSRCPVALATPKSMTLGVALPSTSVTRMLPGFRSRWMTPFWWACCTARQTWTNRASRAAGGRRWRSQYSVMGTPRTSSIAKNGAPSGVVPPS